jgi:hypothetical protein
MERIRRSHGHNSIACIMSLQKVGKMRSTKLFMPGKKIRAVEKKNRKYSRPLYHNIKLLM